jgi:protein transport protein SEC31
LIATGTKAGAVDADFSNETQLELWELKLDDSEQGVELKPVATVSVESRYKSNQLVEPIRSK